MERRKDGGKGAAERRRWQSINGEGLNESRGGKDEGEKRGTKKHTEGNGMEGKKNLRKGSEKRSGISFPLREKEATAVSNEEMESGWIERTISSKCSWERKRQKMKEKEGGETFSLMDRWSSEGEKKKLAGLSKTGREWETDFHPWDQTTTNQPSPLKCKWGVSFQYETSAAWVKKVTPALTKWLTAKKLNKLQDFVRSADNLNPWLTKYHFHISLLQQHIMEILNLENKLFKYWHSSLRRDGVRQSIQSQITTGHSWFTGQLNFSS